MAVNYNAKVATDGLILYLDAANTKSYSGSGTVWTDLSGSGNTGTLANGPTYSSSNSGYITFDGADDFVYTNNFIAGPTALTICVWFSTTTTNGKKLIGFENNQLGTGSSAYDRMLYMGADGKIYFGIYDVTFNITASTSALNDGNWHYAVGTYGGEGTTMRLYIDGFSNSTTTSNTPVNYNGYFRIGSYALDGWTGSSTGYFNGKISQVSVYNRGLTASEVQQNFNALRGRYNI